MAEEREPGKGKINPLTNIERPTNIERGAKRQRGGLR
mgnify:CR=1 FL=1